MAERLCEFESHLGHLRKAAVDFSRPRLFLLESRLSSLRPKLPVIGRIVKKLCLGVDVAETEDEKFGVVDSV